MKSSFLNNPDGKNTIIKQKILSLCINEGEYSIAELSKETNTSIPTVTKLVSELIEEGYLEDLGKMGTSGGRRPSIYGLKASAGYFIGADISRNTALTYFNCSGNPGKSGKFTVTAWFDNNDVPEDFTTGSWNSNGQTVEIEYVKAE